MTYTVSFWKYTNSLSPPLTPKFLHRYFPRVNTLYRASSDDAFRLRELFVYFVIVCVHEHVKNFLYPHLLATTKAFVVQTGNASLHEVIPCHYDNDSEEKKSGPV